MNISWMSPETTHIGRQHNLALLQNIIRQSMYIPLSDWFSGYVRKPMCVPRGKKQFLRLKNVLYCNWNNNGVEITISPRQYLSVEITNRNVFWLWSINWKWVAVSSKNLSLLIWNIGHWAITSSCDRLIFSTHGLQINNTVHMHKGDTVVTESAVCGRQGC